MAKRKIIPYDPALKAKARHLRKNMTPAERALWQKIRRKQVHGQSFYRQRPIGRYIVDFYCPDLMLAIEVDGRSHDGRLHYDRRRQRQLEALGVRLLRFGDLEVMRDIENVPSVIGDWIEMHTPR